MTVRTQYDVIGVEPTASTDEIKKKFRQQIALYHPDKVQHLGREFRELASARTTELTQAYHLLTDEQRRAEYDRQLGGHSLRAQWSEAQHPAAGPTTAVGRADAQAARDGCVRRAALVRFCAAIEAELVGCQLLAARGFDAGYIHQQKRGLFRRARTVRVLGRFVRIVDAAELRKAWQEAIRIGQPDAAEQAVVFLMGTSIAPAGELAAGIVRQGSGAGARNPVIIVPIDVRDWQALVPKAVPDLVKPLLLRLRCQR